MSGRIKSGDPQPKKLAKEILVADKRQVCRTQAQTACALPPRWRAGRLPFGVSQNTQMLTNRPPIRRLPSAKRQLKFCGAAPKTTQRDTFGKLFMYANTSSSSPFASRTQRATMYSKVGLETDVEAASPHRLVSMLFDGVFDAMNQAKGAILNGNNEIKNRALSRSVRILDEGLKASLNMQAGDLATDLRDLYAYTCMRLTYANLHSDPAAIEECQRLLSPIRDAWMAIAPVTAQLKKAA